MDYSVAILDGLYCVFDFDIIASMTTWMTNYNTEEALTTYLLLLFRSVFEFHKMSRMHRVWFSIYLNTGFFCYFFLLKKYDYDKPEEAIKHEYNMIIYICFCNNISVAVSEELNYNALRSVLYTETFVQLNTVMCRGFWFYLWALEFCK